MWNTLAGYYSRCFLMCVIISLTFIFPPESNMFFMFITSQRLSLGKNFIKKPIKLQMTIFHKINFVLAKRCQLFFFGYSKRHSLYSQNKRWTEAKWNWWHPNQTTSWETNEGESKQHRNDTKENTFSSALDCV